MTALEPLNVVRTLPLRIEDFLLLDESGAFAEYGKTELIEGGIVYMNAQHRPHAWVKSMLWHELHGAFAGTGLTILSEVTVAMPPHNAPEPDLVATSQPRGDGPVPLASVALVVEVADTTLAQDLDVKMRVYATNGVPEYWVASVEERAVIVMSQPVGNRYEVTTRYLFGSKITVATFADITVDTAQLV